jgi:hypothetical protein
MCRAAYVAVVAARPHPRKVRWRNRHLEDAADDNAVTLSRKLRSSLTTLARADEVVPPVYMRDWLRNSGYF